MRSRPGAQHQSAECSIASCVVLLVMSTCPRFLCARTEPRHKESAHIKASAAASKRLNNALKAEAINRKAQPLPRLTTQEAQDIKDLSECATDIQKAETLSLLDASDVEQRAHLLRLANFLELYRRSWHTLDARLQADADDALGAAVLHGHGEQSLQDGSV
jgi:hypothetical protein